MSDLLVKSPQIDPAKVAALSRLFKIFNQNTGRKEPFILTPTQQNIFNTIVTRSDPRVLCLACSQYGKSETVACAVLLRAILFPEKWAIIAPTIPKTMIIMRKVIEHVFDDPIFSSQLDITDSLDRLRKERSKSRLTFKGGGEIFILSADTKNKRADGETLMGHGCLTSDVCVITNEGEKTIKEIVDSRFSGKVLSYDESSKEKVWKSITGHFPNQRENRRLLKITVGSSSITLTEDHPVYVTGKGFIAANKVSLGDEVVFEKDGIQ